MKQRNCENCIAYFNPYEGHYEKCGLGFEPAEDLVHHKNGMIELVVHPYQDCCCEVDYPQTKEDFVRIAGELGIPWDIEDVADDLDLL